MRALRHLEAGVASLALVLLVLGGSLWLLTTPGYVRMLVRAVDSAKVAGLSEQATLDVAEDVRRFVIDPEAPSLPPTVDGAPAFDSAAVSHLIDVRNVMVPMRRLTLGLFALLAIWVVLRWRTAAGKRTVANASVASSAVLFGGATLALVIGVVDFEAFFAWFHSLFFAEGTWTFPYDALLIRVFPLSFWIGAGATWGALVLIAATALCWFARCRRFTAGMYGV